MASVLVATLGAESQIVTLLATAAAPVDRMVRGLRTQPPSITVMTIRRATPSAISTQAIHPTITNSQAKKSVFSNIQDCFRQW